MINRLTRSTIFTFMLILMLSCEQKRSIENLYRLTVSEIVKEIPIDTRTKIYTRTMHHFIDSTGIEYLSLEDSETVFDYHFINFYRLDSCKLSHQVRIQKEGANGVSEFMGHGVCDLDKIFLSSCHRPMLYQINRAGEVVKKYNFEQTDDGKYTSPFDMTSLLYKPLLIVGSEIYGTQFPPPRSNQSHYIKGDEFEDIPLSVMIDTCFGSVQTKFFYPRLWEKGEGLGFNTHCSRAFDGKHFVYAFRVSENLWVTEDHVNAKAYPAKSKYIPNVHNEGYSANISHDDYIKATNGAAEYGNLIYDSFRKIYYRFAFPECNIENSSLEYLHCRKEFSIMIINADFEVIGETYFPAGQYATVLFFVNKDGLYLSENHIDKPDLDEDILKFRCLKLEKN